MTCPKFHATQNKGGTVKNVPAPVQLFTLLLKIPYEVFYSIKQFSFDNSKIKTSASPRPEAFIFREIFYPFASTTYMTA